MLWYVWIDYLNRIVFASLFISVIYISYLKLKELSNHTESFGYQSRKTFWRILGSSSFILLLQTPFSMNPFIHLRSEYRYLFEWISYNQLTLIIAILIAVYNCLLVSYNYVKTMGGKNFNESSLLVNYSIVPFLFLFSLPWVFFITTYHTKGKIWRLQDLRDGNVYYTVYGDYLKNVYFKILDIYEVVFLFFNMIIVFVTLSMSIYVLKKIWDLCSKCKADSETLRKIKQEVSRYCILCSVIFILIFIHFSFCLWELIISKLITKWSGIEFDLFYKNLNADVRNKAKKDLDLVPVNLESILVSAILIPVVFIGLVKWAPCRKTN